MKVLRALAALGILAAAAAAALALWTLGAQAATPPVEKPIPELPAAVEGNNWTVVAPLFSGTDGNTSFVRFANGNAFPITVTYLLVGSPTGRLYGSAQYTIPAAASPQYAYSQILSKAAVAGLTGGDTSITLYLRSSASLTAFQHVIFNGANGFFENASICTWDPGFTYAGLNQALINVHTTRLVAYPSTVMMHHWGLTAAVYRADVYEAGTGAYKGGFNFNMAANETFSTDWSWYQDTVRWSPTAAEMHANIIFSRADGGAYQAVVGQAIANRQFGTLVNMTQACGINK